MKKLLITGLLSSLLFSDSLEVTGLAFSKHNQKGYNQSHNWIGLKYTKSYFDYKYGIEYANFKNSYNNNTDMLSVYGSWLPIKVKDFKAGLSLAVGVQKGYCIKDFETVPCQDNLKDSSLFILPSLQAEYSLKEYDIGMNITYNHGIMSRMYITLLKF